MADIGLPNSVISRLENIAQRENRTVAEVLESLLDRYEPEDAEMSFPTEENEDIPPLGTLARLAYEIEKAGFLEIDTPEGGYTRELLEKEFGDYLMEKKGRWDAE